MVRDIGRIAEFIASFPEGSAEREYHGALLSIVSLIEFDQTNIDVALGLLEFLNSENFIGARIDTTTHSIAGSGEENALFVSHLFSNTNPECLSWKWRAMMAESKGVQEWHQWWKNAFRDSALVTKVY